MRQLLVFLMLMGQIPLWGQGPKDYQLRTVAFYNLENLFDTRNDSLTYDDDRTPEGKDRWTTSRYEHKLSQLAKVISQIGSPTSPGPPDVLGVCEAENKAVLNDLIHHPRLKKYGYGLVHFDSPDERGIDVALLYRKSAFIPTAFNSRRLLLFNAEGFRDHTRDQLVVEGLLDNEPLYFIVNHWPSRSGGEARSRPYRLAAAQLNKRIIDSLRRANPGARIIGMGDFNDDPIDPSFKKVLKVKGKKHRLDSLDLFGPMEKLFKKGEGSLAYRDRWNLFDQVYLTANLVHGNRKRYTFWKAGIFAPAYLTDPKGRFKGYPLRTYAGGSYVGGYSDHFPVYVHLIREAGSQQKETSGSFR
ncbi:endonuclease/exonuclease/phosphatase family protein [Maribacter sp. 2307ULW6-5]|uniref:endonuclease/exonuclease/phosphatase family protein n=1 Tax=Maribacter sp. 2307ULW6-5 TaxID=3386275 RepID=UPI0039BC3388